MDSSSKTPSHIDPKEDTITLTKQELESKIKEAVDSIIEKEIVHVQTAEQFSGPVPHPQHMKEYKEIDPSLPSRLTGMAESNLKHLQFMDKAGLAVESVMGFLGWLTPTAISFYALTKSYELIQNDKSIESLVALVTALGALGGAFYIKNRSKKQ